MTEATSEVHERRQKIAVALERRFLREPIRYRARRSSARTMDEIVPENLLVLANCDRHRALGSKGCDVRERCCLDSHVCDLKENHD